MREPNHSQAGFSAVELLITLFIAAAFLTTGYQLYSVIINDGAAARLRATADNIAYEDLRQYSGQATAPCTPVQPSPSATIPADSNLPDASIGVAINCPYGSTSNTSKVEVTINYDTPQQQVVHSLYVNNAASYAGEPAPPADPPANPTAPATPSLTASPSTAAPTRNNLSWNAPSGTSYYSVRRSVNSNMSGAVAETNTTATSFVSSGLAEGTTYYYQVQAIGTNGQKSNWSNAAQATTYRSTAYAITTFYGIPSGVSLLSAGGVFRMTMQGDGNLVVYRMSDNWVKWNSGTYSPGARLVLQSDGNMVIYNTGNAAIWSTGTGGANSSGYHVVMEDSGNLGLYNPSNVAIW